MNIKTQPEKIAMVEDIELSIESPIEVDPRQNISSIEMKFDKDSSEETLE